MTPAPGITPAHVFGNRCIVFASGDAIKGCQDGVNTGVGLTELRAGNEVTGVKSGHEVCIGELVLVIVASPLCQHRDR